MGLMTLGTLTFEYNPKINFPIIKPKVSNSVVETYEGVAYFSWEPTVVGNQVVLEWEWMDSEEFDLLDAIYQADAQVVFDPNDNSGNTYNVVVFNLEGDYFINMDSDSTVYRKNIRLTLLIMSQV